MSGGKQDTEDAHRRSRVGECVIPSTYFAAFDLGRMLPLTSLAVAAGGRSDRNVFYDLVLRCHDTGTVSNTFSTGNVVVVGCKSEHHALLSAYLHAQLISDTIGIHCTPLNITICNMVCRTEIEYSIPPPKYPGEPLPPEGGYRMRMLQTELQKLPHHFRIDYKPEKFPCLWWRARVFPHDPHNTRMVTFAFFERGRGVVTGGLPGEAEIYNQILKQLPSCERGREDRPPTEEELALEAADAFQALAAKKKPLPVPCLMQPAAATTPTHAPATGRKRKVQHVTLEECGHTVQRAK